MNHPVTCLLFTLFASVFLHTLVSCIFPPCDPCSLDSQCSSTWIPADRHSCIHPDGPHTERHSDSDDPRTHHNLCCSLAPPSLGCIHTWNTITKRHRPQQRASLNLCWVMKQEACARGCVVTWGRWECWHRWTDADRGFYLENKHLPFLHTAGLRMRGDTESHAFTPDWISREEFTR